VNIQLKNPLTGVYIRDFIKENLEREIARAYRHERSLCIALIDLDNFQELHNQYGSKISEQILIQVTSRIQLTLRQSDSLLGHWTAHEFLLCLMECNLRGALSTLERIKSRVSSEPLHVQAHQISVTLTIGIASLHPNIKSETLIQEAEHALNQAKQKGFNQICHLEI
jgi:diguanylate cyclase (GGDEF)-like protein